MQAILAGQAGGAIVIDGASVMAAVLPSRVVRIVSGVLSGGTYVAFLRAQRPETLRILGSDRTINQAAVSMPTPATRP